MTHNTKAFATLGREAEHARRGHHEPSAPWWSRIRWLLVAVSRGGREPRSAPLDGLFTSLASTISCWRSKTFSATSFPCERSRVSCDHQRSSTVADAVLRRQLSRWRRKPAATCQQLSEHEIDLPRDQPQLQALAVSEIFNDPVPEERGSHNNRRCQSGCGGRMRLLAVITVVASAARLIHHRGEPPSSPRALPLETRRTGKARLYDDAANPSRPRSRRCSRALNWDCSVSGERKNDCGEARRTAEICSRFQSTPVTLARLQSKRLRAPTDAPSAALRWVRASGSVPTAPQLFHLRAAL